MNIDDRIERRLRPEATAGTRYEVPTLSPVVHPTDPTGRGSELEALLSALDPVFTGTLPPSICVHGPKGSGKSAVVASLFAQLATQTTQHGRAIVPATRPSETELPSFVYVDARDASTRFQLYRTILMTLGCGDIPNEGVRTDKLSDQLCRYVRAQTDVVVAVDHTNESGTPEMKTVDRWLADVHECSSLICVSRQPPEVIEWEPEICIEFDQYPQSSLVELLMNRASNGVVRKLFEHDQMVNVAAAADGDAHDALAAALCAALAAERAEAGSVDRSHLQTGLEAVPDRCVSLGRLLALPHNRQRLLYELGRLEADDLRTVGATARALAATEAVDLSVSTVRRVLYELADAGVFDRVAVDCNRTKGRPPSRLVTRFPKRVFERLYERHSRVGVSDQPTGTLSSSANLLSPI